MINVSNIFSGFSAHTNLSGISTTANYVAPAIELKPDDLQGLKDEIAGVDFSAVSQKELADLGGKLFQRGLINESVLGAFVLGNADFDERGLQQNTEKKFDAIAYFDSQLKGSNEGLASGEASYSSGNNLLKQVNQVIGVLSFFSKSDSSTLDVSVKV